MTYRDDHDAALARAAALERELAQERERAAAAEAERRRLQLEVDALRGRRTPIRRGPRASAVARAAERDALQQARTIWIVSGCAAMAVLALFVLALRGTSGERMISAPPNPACTLRTDPAGADVYAIRGDQVDHVGTTPLTRSRADWERGGRYEARLAGHAPRTVVPLAGMGCATQVHALAPH